MTIPTTTSSAEILLISAFVLLGIWASTFKLAGNRWRFELYSVDFAIGGVLFAILAAYGLGAYGADVGFAENLMLASKTNEALAMIGGGFFALGAALLLSAISLLGLSFAYVIVSATTVMVLVVVEFAGFRLLYLAGAALVALLALIFSILGTKSAEAVLPAVSLPVTVLRKRPSTRSTPAPQVQQGIKNSTKGTVVGILSGAFFGAAVYPFSIAVSGQFGLGTFAGLLIFFIGALISMAVISFLLINIPIHGGPTTILAYFRGSFGKHLLGLLGGMFCAAGVLFITMLSVFPADAKPDELWIWGSALGSAVLAIALGLGKWSELSGAPGGATRNLLIAVLLLLAAVGVLAYGMDKTPTLASQAAVGAAAIHS